MDFAGEGACIVKQPHTSVNASKNVTWQYGVAGILKSLQGNIYVIDNRRKNV